MTLLERGEIHLGQNLLHAVKLDERHYGSLPLGSVELLAACQPTASLGKGRAGKGKCQLFFHDVAEWNGGLIAILVTKDPLPGLADHLAQWSETPHGLTCTYLSAAHRAVAGEIARLMQKAGLQTHTDAAANVVGRHPSKDEQAKTLIIASHYDTVINAGKYDGRLGILAGILVAERLVQSGRHLPFHLEVIAFSEEEGVRFSAPYIGSSAIAGRFDRGLLERRDADGVSLADALRGAGLEADGIPQLSRRSSELCAYIEVHIEQGPVLLDSDLPVGIVTAIAGNSRYSVSIEGSAGHAGTVPMRLRHEAAALRTRRGFSAPRGARGHLWRAAARCRRSRLRRDGLVVAARC